MITVLLLNMGVDIDCGSFLPPTNYDCHVFIDRLGYRRKPAQAKCSQYQRKDVNTRSSIEPKGQHIKLCEVTVRLVKKITFLANTELMFLQT